MRGKYVLAIDLGTSGPKVALMSTAGEVLDWRFHPTELLLLPGGGAEQRPDDWWQAIATATRQVLDRTAPRTADIAAVSCTTQWSGTVAVDRAGAPLGNAIIWLDARGAPHVRWAVRGWPSIAGYQIAKLWRCLRLTGGIAALSGKDSIAHILYLQHERPEIYRSAAALLEPKDYLNLRLTGRCAASHESVTLCWVTDNRNPKRITYDPRLFALWGVDREKFPPLQRAVDLLGPLRQDAAAELGLPAGIPVVTGTPDVHSAAIGSGAVRDFDAHLYVGSSSWLTCHVPWKKTSIYHHMASLPAAIPGRYFVADEQETAGACIRFLRDGVLFGEDSLSPARPPADFFAAFDRLAATAPAGSGRILFTPWLYGERTPIDDRTVRAGFHNLSLETTRGHLARAVLEGVAYNTRWLLQNVEGFVGRRWAVLRLVGGGAQSDLWCQIFADVLGRKIEQVEAPILANVRGAGLLAGVALGHLTFDQIPDRVPVARTFTPEATNQPIYDRLFREFVHLYRCNRRIHARLNRPW